MVHGAGWWALRELALRGGENGVKTMTGDVIAPQVSTYLVAQDKDLTLPENEGLLQGLPAGTAAKLEGIRQLYANPVGWTNTGSGWAPGAASTGQVSAFEAIDLAFSQHEIASLQTFVVDPNPHIAR